MSECTCEGARFGQKISPLEFSAYDPNEGGFVEVSSKKILDSGNWLILVFYPADITFVCPTELADIAGQHEALKKAGAEVISISTDSKFVHLAWKNAEKLLENIKFLMGADPTGAISRYFGIYDEAGGTAYRGTFIINPDGVLVSSEINFYNVGRNALELLRKVKANAYLRKNPAEVCPANWEEGRKTLKPSPQMVGKVYEALK
jgi:peroxiredoxin (alkyl hydroperoxide reductase subunit C)